MSQQSGVSLYCWEPDEYTGANDILAGGILNCEQNRVIHRDYGSKSIYCIFYRDRYTI